MVSKIPLTLTSSMVLLRFIMSICLTITTIYADPIRTTNETQNNLFHFGNLPASARNPANGDLLDRNTFLKAISNFQGLNSRSKRYVLYRRKWSSKALSYRITKYSKRLSRHEVDRTIAKAFSLWSEYTNLTFTAKQTGAVNIEISFVEGEHGDDEPFSGPDGILAHTSYPPNGQIHFDDSEYWTIGSKSYGKDLFEVAAHEIGHAVGLYHSDKDKDYTLMAPKYKGNGDVRLHYDDIQGIQAIYGEKTENGKYHYGDDFSFSCSDKTRTNLLYMCLYICFTYVYVYSIYY